MTYFPNTTAEEALERRLSREAAEHFLGTRYHRECLPDTATWVRVEVSYQYTEGDREHCGYFLVAVPTRESVGDEVRDMQNHPATLAHEALDGVGDEWAYFSIDETYPA